LHSASSTFFGVSDSGEIIIEKDWLIIKNEAVNHFKNGVYSEKP
jgi:hypothetical protein